MTSCPAINNQQTGFTLLEIMVVITIVALMSTAVIVTTADQKITAGQLKSQQAQLASLLRALAQNAQLKQQWSGLYFEDNRYQPMIFSQRQWQLMPNSTAQQIPEPLPFLLLINNQITGTQAAQDSAKKSVKTPQILISPAGIFNNFEIRFGDEQQPEAILSDPYANI